MAELDDQNRLLVEAQNVLGTDVRVPFQGQGDLAASAAGGLPAPSATGQGQSGQAGRSNIPGAAGGAGGIPDVSKLLKLLGGTPDLGTRGATGGVSLSDLLRSLEGLGELGTAANVDAVRGLFGGEVAGTPLLPGGTFVPGAPGEPIINSFGGSLSDILRGGAGSTIPAAAQSGAEAVAPAAEAATGATGAVGDVATGGAALTAILGLIAQLTGDPQLAQAAQAAGAATNVVGGAATGLAAAGGSTAGAVATPVAAAWGPLLLADSINQMLGGEPIYDFGAMFGGSPHYQGFNPKLMAHENAQGQALSALAQGLPYVQSQEELGQLLNSYKKYVTSTTGSPLTGGDPSNIYGLATIPGTGPITHGQPTPAVDWGTETQQLQAVIDQLKGVLPGQAVTDPTATLQGEAGMRLFDQFLPREQVAPLYTPGGSVTDPGTGQTISLGPGLFTASEIAAAGAPSIAYGQPGYDYAAGRFPAPGQYVGTISPYWQQLAGGAPAPAPAAGGGLDSIAAAALSTPPGDFAGGMLPEDERKKLLA